MLRIVALSFVLLPAACAQKASEEDKQAQEPESATSDSKATTRPDGDLTEAEVKEYLDGKSIDLSGIAEAAKDGAAKTPQLLVLKKSNIRAVRIHGGISVSSGPWTHDITLLYDNGPESYAVELSVEHRMVANQQAFFGFKVNRVVKQ
jgi:hypothetical protein